MTKYGKCIRISLNDKVISNDQFKAVKWAFQKPNETDQFTNDTHVWLSGRTKDPMPYAKYFDIINMRFSLKSIWYAPTISINNNNPKTYLTIKWGLCALIVGSKSPCGDASFIVWFYFHWIHQSFRYAAIFTN